MAKSTYYVVQRFRIGKRGMFEKADPIQCNSADHAARTAHRLGNGIVGAIAFSRSGDAALGEYGEAVILASVGALPDLTEEAA